MIWKKETQAAFQTFSDLEFIVGRSVSCEDIQCTQGELKPGTIYGLQLRVYSVTGIVTSRHYFASTLTNTRTLRFVVALTVTLALGVVLLCGAVFAGIIPRKWYGLSPEMGSAKPQKPVKVEQLKAQEKSSAKGTGRNSTSPVKQRVLSLDELCAYLDECLAPGNGTLNEQFVALRRSSLKREIEEKFTTYHATDPGNKNLNRYPDIIPYDHTLVLIKGRCEDGVKTKHYINASYIYAVNPCESPNAPPVLNPSLVEYIASQGPLRRTVADFWEMIAQNEVKIIVMLTNVTEKNVSKCTTYWPHEKGAAVIHMGHEKELVLTLQSEEDYPDYVIRRMELFYGPDEVEPREVIQLHMKNWPDHGEPKLAEFSAFHDAYHDLKKSVRDGCGPTLVHCSAGVGRSGIFIAADIIRRQLEDGVELFDIQGIISQLRSCRMHLVQKAVQYVFLHLYVRSLLEKYVKQ